ncbi:DivIVA domain-containing protein [Streptomyces sp. NPDC026673]|uniref:DivIVA domain-containing protein n=1 Tax=Streptomyces sp. NPDC026673 TaxID=3155724 RepID=UPI0033FDBA7C
MAQTPITPENVRRMQFTTVRLREAYDEREVDDFLDEVQTELTRLLRINQDLRAELSAAEAAAARRHEEPELEVASEPEPEAEQEREREPEQVPEPEPAPALVRAAEVAEPAEPEAPGDAAEIEEAGEAEEKRSGFAVDSTARLLALAERTAEQAVAEARAEAHKIVGEALGQAESLRRDARDRALALEHEAREKHRQAMVSLASARTTLQRKVEDLRTFESAYRARLTTHLQSQMRRLDRDLAGSLAPPSGPTTVSLTRTVPKGGTNSQLVPPASAPPATTAPDPAPSPTPAQETATLTAAGSLSGEED